MSYRLIGMNINLRSFFHKQSDYFIHARPKIYLEKILISYITTYRNRMRFKFSNNLCQGGKRLISDNRISGILESAVSLVTYVHEDFEQDSSTYSALQYC
jgi:hypothetical protein